MAVIDKTAIIDPAAKIAEDVHVGAYSIIGADVEHVVIQGPTKIGRDNKIYQFSSIGEASQDKKFIGQRAFLEIGDRNTIREFCTLNRGTLENAYTRIGNDNLFMAYVHIAHDCEVGNHTIFANNASLAGHVKVEDYAILSGFAGVFQFCRIGAYSFAATNSVIIKDVPPYVKVSGYYAKPFGLNTVGLQRHGFSDEILNHLRRAYKIIYRNGLTIANALEELRKMALPQVNELVRFIETSTAGIVR
jgi:UDP-N-acetylglucosamine acyltransferase